MTNELGTTLQDLEDKAERKREALDALDKMYNDALSSQDGYGTTHECFETIRKYIEEN